MAALSGVALPASDTDRIEQRISEMAAQVEAVSLMADGLYQRDEGAGVAVGAIANALAWTVESLQREWQLVIDTASVAADPAAPADRDKPRRVA